MRRPALILSAALMLLPLAGCRPEAAIRDGAATSEGQAASATKVKETGPTDQPRPSTGDANPPKKVQ